MEGDVQARVLAVLRRAGRPEADGGWGEPARRALMELGGIENLEERLQFDDRIDRLALEHLERCYPG
ncbi:MAG: putative peptidoglycan binding domain-containing protein [Deinococcales bacterium]